MTPRETILSLVERLHLLIPQDDEEGLEFLSRRGVWVIVDALVNNDYIELLLFDNDVYFRRVEHTLASYVLCILCGLAQDALDLCINKAETLHEGIAEDAVRRVDNWLEDKVFHGAN